MPQQRITNEGVSPNPVIVCNCHYNGLAILQELGHRGIPCIAADCRREIGTFSRYAKFKKVPSPVSDERGFVDTIINIAKSLPKKPVIFPTNDEWAMALSRYRDELQEVAIPLVSDFEAIREVLDKRRFYKFGEEQGYPTPKIYDPHEALREDGKISFPVVIKPGIRRFSAGEDEGGFTFPADLRFNIIENKEELRTFLSQWESYRDYLFISEYIPGMSDTNITVGIYSDHNSRIQKISTSRKVRGYPADSGTWVMAKSEPVPEELIRISRKICTNLKLFGVCEIEFKQHSGTGDYYLIEINPRSWAFIGLTPLSGVNLPLAAYQDVTGIKLTEVSDFQQDDIYFGKITEDLINCTLRYKREYPEWHYSLNQWRNFYRRNQVYSAEFHYPDYPVWGVVLVKILRNLWKALRGK